MLWRVHPLFLHNKNVLYEPPNVVFTITLKLLWWPLHISHIITREIKTMIYTLYKFSIVSRILNSIPVQVRDSSQSRGRWVKYSLQSILIVCSLTRKRLPHLLWWKFTIQKHHQAAKKAHVFSVPPTADLSIIITATRSASFPHTDHYLDAKGYIWHKLNHPFGVGAMSGCLISSINGCNIPNKRPKLFSSHKRCEIFKKMWHC